jgi:hypothetical protein
MVASKGLQNVDELPLSARIESLEHQSQTILFLGAINLIMNVLTIAIGFLLAV